jgi:hypothetical protein
MKRRNFLQQTGTALVFAPLLGTGTLRSATQDDSLSRLIDDMVEANDLLIQNSLEQQADRPGHRFDGGIADAYGMATAGGTAMFLQRVASAYVAPNSVFYGEGAPLIPMKRAIEFLLRTQHADGTIDLLATNFHSPPDTGFVVEPLCLAYTLFLQAGDARLTEPLAQMKTFLLHAGQALSVGGIHTPNHRWVVSMALARLHALFPNPQYLDRINTWLAEGIDIDPDGQYTEKSSLVYTPLTNRCLITIARLTDHKELFQPVRQNLEMTLYYLHPNGEVVTEASRRQDQYRVGTTGVYYYPYRFMALQDGNERFAQMTHRIEEQSRGEGLTRWLAYLQEDAFLRQAVTRPLSDGLPKNYEKAFPYSNLVRVRRNFYDATILGGGMLFFAFQNGDAVLQGIRCHAAFFGSKGQFTPRKIEKEGDAYLLKYQAKGPYYQPFEADQISEDGDWEKMPRANRQQSEVQELSYETRIEETENGFVLDFRITGTDHVPVAIELGFRQGGTLSGVRTVEGIEDAFLLSGEQGIYQWGKDQIRFGPGQMEHTWTQVRGAPPKMKAMSVYMTGFTPFAFRLEILAKG